jgi:hypothetical protein
VADELSRAGDAVALAELVTAVTALPPLAVGLFGDWGEGKSHFLDLMQQQVTTVAQPGNVLACLAVRQVRFNAWHYAETDLWASLVAELFAQLAAPPGEDLGTEQRRQSRLAADLIAQRGVGVRLRAARDRRDSLKESLCDIENGGQRSWKALPEHQRQELQLLIGPSAERLYRQAARTGLMLRETTRATWRLARAFRPAQVACLAAAAVTSVATAIIIAIAVPGLARSAASVPAIAAVLTAVGLWHQIQASSTTRIRAAWNTATAIGQAHQQRLQTAVDVATAEVAALEREMQNLTAAGQLAAMVADRVSTGDYRRHLGVMTQIREDFTRMAALLATTARVPALDAMPTKANQTPVSHRELAEDEAGDTLPRIDRIIVYIDDLDRCPPRRVVEMLEAIHLLLAVPLFVVVVAVDPRWLLRAITVHYRDLIHAPASQANPVGATGQVDPDDEELWQTTPDQYLEKIFQVVLTLPPLDTVGYRQLLRSLVGTRTSQPGPGLRSTAEPAAETAVPYAQSQISELTDPSVPTSNKSRTGMPKISLPAPRIIERVDPLTLEPDELALLDLLGPPLLVNTPRAVKKLANSYGLLTALRRNHRISDLVEQHSFIASPNGHERVVSYYPYRASMVMLAALTAYPSLGPAFFLHLHHIATKNPNQLWKHFLESLVPTPAPRWHNLADPEMTPVQAQQWQALLDALHNVNNTAAEHNLHLPSPLIAWHEWIVPVGRLSFPTGRIVSTLDRQPPLPATSSIIPRDLKTLWPPDAYGELK